MGRSSWVRHALGTSILPFSRGTRRARAADIQSYFDTIDHSALRGFLDKRVTDGVIRRAIDKGLKAGVLEDGAVTHPEEGTPQGGVISPILANRYLNELFDRWFETEVKPRLEGRAQLIRYRAHVVDGMSDLGGDGAMSGPELAKVVKLLAQRWF